MATNYPTTLDTTGSTLPNNKVDATTTGSNDHAGHHDNLADAIIAVETALGTNPFGSYATVAAAIANKFDLSPGTAQVILPTADVVGLTVKQHNSADTSNLFEARLSTNALAAYIDKTGVLSAIGYKVSGTALAASHLSNGVSGTGAVVLASAIAALAPLASPTLTGTPVAPTATGGTNTTQIATTQFVTSAIAGASTPAGTSGLLSAIPSAASSTGKFYYATDQAVLYFSNGSSWYRQSVPAGTTVDWFNASVPTGWVAYDGGTLGGSTGIYADLYSHLGSTTALPDTRGRVTVAKGTHSDVSTILNNEGLSTVSYRRPKHQHTVYDPGHAHTYSGGPIYTSASIPYSMNSGGSTTVPNSPSGTLSIDSNTTGIKINPAGASSSTDSQDASPYIVCLKIAKL